MKKKRLLDISIEEENNQQAVLAKAEEAVQKEKPKPFTPQPAVPRVAGTNTIVIAAYHCCGTSTYANMSGHSKDLENDMYKFGIDGQVNPEYPNNYINAIKWHLVNNKWKYLFITCRDEILKALDQEKIPYVVIYPELERKQEIINLCKQRGNTDEFISGLTENYDKSIERLKSLPKSYALGQGEFITDRLFDEKLTFLKQ